MKKLTVRALLATGIVAASCLTETSLAHAADNVVEQGGQVVIGESTVCSVAYNDIGDRTSYTSAHCGESGQRVSLLHADGSISREVGTIMPSPSFSRVAERTPNDWATIYWDGGVALGENRFSGDDRVRVSALQAGDRVCMYGGASGRTTCGRFVGSLGNNVYWSGLEGIRGDSGSPVWVEGRGLIGPYSGASIITSGNGQAHSLLRASAPADGRIFSVQEEIDLVARHHRINGPVKHEVKQPVDTVGQAADFAAGSAAKIEQSALSGSSNGADSTGKGSSWEAGTFPVIAAIIVGVLVAAAPELARIVELVRR